MHLNYDITMTTNANVLLAESEIANSMADCIDSGRSNEIDCVHCDATTSLSEGSAIDGRNLLMKTEGTLCDNWYALANLLVGKAVWGKGTEFISQNFFKKLFQ